MQIERLEQRIQWSGVVQNISVVPASNIDPTFGSQGVAEIDLFDQDSSEAVVVQNNGKIVLAGWSGPAPTPEQFPVVAATSISMVRLNNSGSIDTSFGDKGFADFPIAPNTRSEGENLPMILLSDGSFLVGGQGVRKVGPDGKLISSFGSGGVAISDSRVSDMKLTSDGKIVTMDDAFGLQRLNADGTIDGSFTASVVNPPPPLQDQSPSRQMAIQSDGKIVVVGSPSYVGTPHLLLKRFNADGTPDTAFGDNGQVLTGSAKQNINGWAVEMTPDGEIQVAGTSETGVALARYLDNGSLDTSFGTGGLVVNDPVPDSDFIFDIAFDSSGKFLVAGPSEGGFGLVRYNNDGTRDTSFGDNGVSNTQLFGLDFGSQRTRAIAFAPGGKIVLVGDIDGEGMDPASVISQEDFFAVRLNYATISRHRPDAALDSNGTLIITTGAGDDHITVGVSGSNVSVNRNGAITNFALSAVKALDIQSGDGNDTVTTSGPDVPEQIDVGAGNDSVTTGAEDDVIQGSTGDKTIDSGGGADSINISGDGNNHIQLQGGSVGTGSGNNTIVGGDGGDAGGVTVDTGDGNDSITTGSGNDSIHSAAGSDTISSGAGNDQIIVWGDTISGTSGTGAIVDAGDGNDTIYADLFDGLVKSIQAGAGDDYIEASSTQTINGGAGNDIIKATSTPGMPVVVFGGDGNDKINTGDGDDTVYGGAGRDTVHAGGGNDRVSGGSGKDLLFGQDGNDRLFGGGGNDRLEGQDGNDRLLGGGGADIINGGDGTDAATHDDSSDLITDVENDLA